MVIRRTGLGVVPLSRLTIESLRFHGRGPIDLAIGTSQCVCISGPSGTGKTLLLRALADLDPHDGRVLLDDVASASIDAPRWRRQVGLLPAESQWWHDSLGGHFSGASVWGLAELGFEPEVMSWPVSRLSTGERQRLALLRLLANRPKALLLDEPTASLDADNVQRVEHLIAAYRSETGAPVLWVSHDSEQERRVADRRLRLRDGQLVEVEKR
jgi:ABC-type iron transport system FetAB ATPase subunit